MKPISENGLARLEIADVSPEFAQAVGIEESDPGVFEITFGLRDKPAVTREWIDGLEHEEWARDDGLGVWWPVGRDGSTVIVCLGASEALFLAQQLFRVGVDGGLYRRSDVSQLLQDAAIVALPCELPDVSFGWYVEPEDGAHALLEEIVVEQRERIFLALPRPPEDLQPVTAKNEPAFNRFVEHFLDIGEGYGIQPSLAMLPWLGRWSELLNDEEYPGAKRSAGLSAIFDLWDQISRGVPHSDGVPG